MINRTIAKFLFYAVALTLLVWTASLTVSFLQSVLPNSFWLVPILGLVVFDGGMVAWMFVFLSHAQGAIQRATAIILTVFNLIGVGLMVIAEILLDGQQWVAPPESLGTVAVWSIGIWTIGNVAGVVLFHLGDNNARKEMAIQSEKDAIFEAALSDLKTRRVVMQKALSQEIGAAMMDEIIADIRADRDGDGRPDIMQRGRQVGQNTYNDHEVIPQVIPVAQPAPGQAERPNGPAPKPVPGAPRDFR